MATLDVRLCGKKSTIDRIQWSEDESLIHANSEYFGMSSKDRHPKYIKYDDIDHLIKALQKAKELWHNKT